MLTPFMQDLNKLLDEHGFDPKTIRSFTVDGPSKRIEVTRYAVAEQCVNSYRKALDPVTGEALLTQHTYPMGAD